MIEIDIESLRSNLQTALTERDRALVEYNQLLRLYE